MERREERTVTVKCENCHKEHVMKFEDMKLIVHCSSYKLYSWECPCCGKTDYARDNFF